MSLKVLLIRTLFLESRFQSFKILFRIGNAGLDMDISRRQREVRRKEIQDKVISFIFFLNHGGRWGVGDIPVIAARS